MDKAIIHCDDCGKEHTIQFEYISDLYGRDISCKHCKSINTFIKDFKWEKFDTTPIKLGNGGCGSVWR